MRKIPTCMATQHPDNAGKPYWNYRALVSNSAEIKECFICFSDLGIDEYNWDWEGKFVDEAVIDRLLHKYYRYFKKYPIGKDKFLTFRIPNPRVEKQFRLARAFMVIITSSQLSQSLGFDRPPIFETILPLTETAEEMIDIQEAFRELVKIDHKLLKMEDSIKHIELIPLFEQVDKIVKSADVLKRYIDLHKEKFGILPQYLRPYCARSDPALNSGLVPTILALKIALSSYLDLEQKTGVKLYPMLGTGSLPFRGGLSPERIDIALDEYKGIATLIIQSGFRYDFNKSSVKKAILKIQEELPKKKAIKLENHQVKNILALIPHFESPYRKTIEGIAGLINSISSEVARRRERVLHIGLFGYSRGIGKISLPRAIPFCASLYSLGIPPELIGTGRGLRESSKKGLTEYLKFYRHLNEDLITAGRYLNRENLLRLAKDKNIWYDIKKDIEFTEKELKVELGPENASDFEHYKLTGTVFDRLKSGKDVSQLITYTGILRKSLG